MLTLFDKSDMMMLYSSNNCIKEKKQWLNNIPEHGNNAPHALIGLVQEKATILGKELPSKALWQKGSVGISTALGEEWTDRQTPAVTAGKNGPS